MKPNKLFPIIFAALVVIAIGGTFILIKSTPKSTQVTPPPVNTPATPRPAPDFTIKLFSGRTISLKDFRGKTPVVLNFWASWCPPCRAEAPTLAKVSKRYEGKVKFLGIAINDTRADSLAFMKEFGISYDNGPDQSNIGASYGLTGVPETFWIDKRGQIVGHWIGAIDEANLTARTEELSR
ncbi:MAG: TlpA disulfide reductase family protein [Actinomycetota bacterium]|nr:TlpA disulfide reductase family protein [Actinomycetota bacterium]